MIRKSLNIFFIIEHQFTILAYALLIATTLTMPADLGAYAYLLAIPAIVAVTSIVWQKRMYEL